MTEDSININDKTLKNSKDIKIKKKIKDELKDWIQTLVVGTVIALSLNNFIIANSYIPTGSMENTIKAGDHVVGSRIAYKLGEVQRDDVIIFKYGYTCKNDGEMYRENDEHACPLCGRKDEDNSKLFYTKRIIGLSGDHIEIKQTGMADASEFTKINIKTNTKVPVGTVYVNGEAKEELYLPEPMIVDNKQFPEIDVVVPEGCYYVLGDNRNNSMDARYWGKYNMVTKESLIAKVYFKYWPLSDIGIIK